MLIQSGWQVKRLGKVDWRLRTSTAFRISIRESCWPFEKLELIHWLPLDSIRLITACFLLCLSGLSQVHVTWPTITATIFCSLRSQSSVSRNWCCWCADWRWGRALIIPEFGTRAWRWTSNLSIMGRFSRNPSRDIILSDLHVAWFRRLQMCA